MNKLNSEQRFSYEVKRNRVTGGDGLTNKLMRLNMVSKTAKEVRGEGELKRRQLGHPFIDRGAKGA